jgi:biopolymer transport protein ExbD
VPPPEADFDAVVVRLRNAGEGVAIEVNGSPMESEAATLAFLRSLAELKADAPVVLAPDPDVAVKHVIRLYDGARLAGFEILQFAASEK